ncbi:MAG: helix-turn-helix domain-containing protein [Gemmatimonas sp.]|nr:helix-turn-helix domain-containing protein [Gemmatimonas sp.]
MRLVFDHSESATAKGVGLPASTIHRMVTGAIAEPRTSKLTQIADALGVPAAWLRGELSTRDAMAGESELSEAQWLLQCHAKARQRDARAKIEQLSGERAGVGRAVAELQLIPGAHRFPLPAVVDLLNCWSAVDPRRVDVERQFAELETALIRLAGSYFENAPQSSINAAAGDED